MFSDVFLYLKYKLYLSSYVVYSNTTTKIWLQYNINYWNIIIFMFTVGIEQLG